MKQSLAEMSPDIAAEWHPTKNGELTPDTVSKCSGKKVWWKGKCGHEWEASIANRVKGRNCPYCSNKKLLSGFNDLQSTFPDIAKEWDYELNEGKLPSEVPKSSKTEYWWKCSKGHQWKASTDSRTKVLPSGNHTGCPYCSGKRVLAGFNDLTTVFPDLAAEWHPSLNNGLKPNGVTKGCSKKIWWICPKGHSYQATIANRTAAHGTNCPYCCNQKLLKGYNDLQTCYPEIAAEWDYDKNGDLKPDDVTMHSKKDVHWICSRGHSWRARISHRTLSGSDCPKCSGRTSFQEQAILFYLNQVFSDVVNLDRTALNGVELDIYIPSISTAIEYDGLYYHRDEKRVEFDKRKNQLCLEHGIHLIRVREEGLPLMEETEYLTIITTKTLAKSIDSRKNFEEALVNLFKQLDLECNISLDRDELKIYSAFSNVKVENALATQYPDVAQEWNPLKNEGLSPFQVSAHAGIRVWWQCKLGHEWKADIASRTTEKRLGCPYCSGRRLLKGVNDLLTCFPEIAKEWHPTLNGELTPADVTKGSSKKVWWRGGDCKHEWLASVSNRTGSNGTKCPFCSNEKLLKGFNDLKTTFPAIAKEWDQDKNGDLSPDDVMGGTVKKVWWLCPEGHSYSTSPHSRTHGNTGCPFCAHVKLLTGFNDLQTCFPEIAEEWHPTLNGNLSPSTVAKSCNKKVWWKCKKNGHEWQATINSRTGKLKPGCPICAGRKTKRIP